ncbi:Crp/Fnr family transcriptional regulator [Chryseobacterium shandongense]|uniref:Crp/Fnr family transcriptional regulator n=1 Tax=Chryseobacterium shandongense TaxID=1493872 RepID=A0AAD1DL25_9FLAO|nr:Crp/Fnr family transcriptional regulator [Chryseobacterium shandongense]AZA85490.1 Crp/Fnr family transcriptional regulator [Chryseobacterium shandongense]AZA97597.1 Crp/Fnr family transcriptional regulator [Chryseobacterium shandongense]
MHDAFFKYLKKFDSEPLTKDEKSIIIKAFSPTKLRKRQYFSHAGNHCKHFAFIVKGAMRQYLVNNKGTELIIKVGIENWWMGDRESFVFGTPSLYHIDAWEDTEMLIIAREDFLKLKKINAIAMMIAHLDERNSIANQKRIASFISLTAEQRYVDFVTWYPQLVSRFPQHIIASYLGITKDTLSRVKVHLKK